MLHPKKFLERIPFSHDPEGIKPHQAFHSSSLLFLYNSAAQVLIASDAQVSSASVSSNLDLESGIVFLKAHESTAVSSLQ
jgi:hypothetical protein